MAKGKLGYIFVIDYSYKSSKWLGNVLNCD